MSNFKPIKLNKIMQKGVSNKAVKTMKLLAIILVVLLLILIAAAQFGGVTFSTVSDYFASAMAKGTSKILARVWAKRVLPEPVGPMSRILLFCSSTSVSAAR